MTAMIPAEFNGVALDIIDHAGKRWLTAEQVGLALGYAADNARKGVNKLYNAHAEEFTEADTCVINLMTQGGFVAESATNLGGNPNVRVFSDTGCIKLGFFANTARAKEFRTWASKVLAGHSVQAPTPAPVQKTANRRLLVTRRMEREVLELFVAGYSQKQLATMMRLSPATISLLIHGKYQFSPLAGEPECSAELIAAVIERHRQLVYERFVAEQQRVANRYLCDGNNQALAQGLNEIGRQRLAMLAEALAGSQMAVAK